MKGKILLLATALVIPTMAMFALFRLVGAAEAGGVIIVNPGESIQQAIDGAAAGDTILIMPGTYTESLTLNKPVSLTGVSSATTILRAEPGDRVLTVTGATIDNSVVISGLTFTGGDLSSITSCPAGCGGGVFITEMALPLIQNITIRGNSAFIGGGIVADTANYLKVANSLFVSNTSTFIGGAAVANFASITNSRFENNHCTDLSCDGGGLVALTFRLTDTTFISHTAGDLGGGAYAFNTAIIRNTLFQDNSSTYGGGLYVEDDLTVINSTFLSNTANHTGGGIFANGLTTMANNFFQHNISTEYGGGLASFAPLNVTNTYFLSNTAGSGGGIFASDTFTVANTIFVGNSAGEGAALLHDFVILSHVGAIVNSLFAGNNGNSALYFNTPGVVRIIHTTIADNTVNPGTAIFVATGTTAITNTLITHHAIGIYNSVGTVNEDYNLFFSNSTHLSGTVASGGNSLFDADPDFVNPAAGDYHLGPLSAALDNALDLGIPNDLDGAPRPQGVGPDRGAYEATPANLAGLIYLPLIVKP
ncbi:MAG: hypothetical protein L0331_13655 [Chloroflexi bacterium]|nr:hypothetical protein [Chloroflexota bacterium]MCI0649401.1 hypothetical protein [Chloroflexota bacterium]